ADHRAGEGLPSSRRHHPNVPRRGVHRGCDPGSPPLPWPSPNGSGLGSPSYTFTTRQASLDAADRSVAHPQRMLDAALRPRALPPEAGSLLPGPLAATRTGPTPASDDELALDHDITSSTSNSGRTPVHRGSSAAALTAMRPER